MEGHFDNSPDLKIGAIFNRSFRNLYKLNLYIVKMLF